MIYRKEMVPSVKKRTLGGIIRLIMEVPALYGSDRVMKNESCQTWLRLPSGGIETPNKLLNLLDMELF